MEDGIMKKIALSTVLLTSLLALTGCGGYETGTVKEDGAWLVVGDRGGYDVLKDIETGCLYLQNHHDRSGIVPYFDEHGEVMGCGEEPELSKY